MDFERTRETQRLKLLRIVAGLVVVVGFLSVGPVSRGFSIWVRELVGAILTRAEAAARCLVIAQAGSMLARSGTDMDRNVFSENLARVFTLDETEVSLTDFGQRLETLRAVLMNLPRHAARLIHRIQKHMRRATRAVRVSVDPKLCVCAALEGWLKPGTRIERPPDKVGFTSLFFLPPPDLRREALAVELAR